MNSSSGLLERVPSDFAALRPPPAGSGGVAKMDFSAAVRTTYLVVRQEHSAPAELSTADRLLLLRRWLSLSVSEVARVLGVQRPTVYAWERGEMPRNASRLRAVYDLASYWHSLSREPLGPLRKESVTSDGESLVALLAEDELDPVAIKAAMGRLSTLQAQRLASRPPSGAELAARFGFPRLSNEEAARNAAAEARGAKPAAAPREPKA